MPFTWRDEVEVVCGDVTRAQDVAAALTGEAVRAGVRRIVYLGGITPRGQQLSRHLASRAEVGRILLAGSVPAIALQAAVIIGSGSASFEMLRYLTERLPVMVTPRWVRNRIQPIAVRDVLYYLTRAAELPGDVVGTFDIGGPDVLSYTRMMHEYAAVAELPPRVIIPVPVLTPWLSAQWVNLVTPVPKAIAVPLMESLVNDVVCADHAIAQHIPDPPDGPIGYRRAVEPALAKIRNLDVPTRWSDADQFGTEPSAPLLTDPEWSGGSLYTDRRERRSSADPARLWAVIEAIGGDHGWYSFPLAWSLRGWIDRLTGGVGLRRGRRDPHRLRAGEALDWWRVERIERPRVLLLRAEMRLPGRAWLELRVDQDEGGTVIPPARVVRAARAGGPPLLEGDFPVPRDRVRRHDAQHHRRGRSGLDLGAVCDNLPKSLSRSTRHPEGVQDDCESARSGGGRLRRRPQRRR